jgi:hypothetical protein
MIPQPVIFALCLFLDCYEFARRTYCDIAGGPFRIYQRVTNFHKQGQGQ